MTVKQKVDRYEMHKYWGKKPASNLSQLIEKYTNPDDTVLDPFSGYGVFNCEAYLAGRNSIANDLNPIANFLNTQLLERDVSLSLLELQWKAIKEEMIPYIDYWYGYEIGGKHATLLSILRNNDDIPIRAKLRVVGEKSVVEIAFNKNESNKFIEFEKKYVIEDWYPVDKLIINSRISAKEGMRVCDLFTTRTLACHARLLSLIEKHSSGNEMRLLKVAFTANLANCSRLVPPIKSRGEMSQGAWMTGFYTGATYIENNVLEYFENRFKKVVRGKSSYLELLESNNKNPNAIKAYYLITQCDAKQLSLKSNSVDYVFTDPPYGGAVPYFEQSIIWNAWMRFLVDYENEIVITDSKARKEKNNTAFESEIMLAFSEIRRVLKRNKYLSFTYHSLSGLEWKAITNACILNGFELRDYEWLTQKSFTPRQINRTTSIKGDVLVTFKNTKLKQNVKIFSDLEIIEMFKQDIKEWLLMEKLDTNTIFLKVMKKILSDKIIVGNVNVLDILKNNFILLESDVWSIG